MSLAGTSLALQYGGDLNSDSTPTPAPGTGSAPSFLTDLVTAAQYGIGLANEAGGGSPIQIGGATPGAPVQTKILGFSVTQIVIGVILIVGIFLVVHFTTK